MRLAKFDPKLRQWRTLGPEAGGNGSRLKNRTEHDSVETFLGLKNGGFAAFCSESAFCGSQKSQWQAFEFVIFRMINWLSGSRLEPTKNRPKPLEICHILWKWGL